MLKTLSIFLFLVICICSCNDSNSNQTLFRNGTPCDSTLVTYNQNGNRIFYCYKDNTESYLITDKKGDTVYLKRFINSLLFEKLQFKNKYLTYASLSMLIRRPKGRDYANNILNFKIKGHEIDKDSSFYFEVLESNDTIFFRANTKYDFQNKVDSTWVSTLEDYFPIYNQISDIDYPSKVSGNQKFHPVLKSKLKDSVKTMISHYNVKVDTLIGVAFDIRYFDWTIYKWNQEIIQRINKDYSQQ